MNTMTDKDTTSNKPWYKEPWLWFLLSVPIASVILSSIMVSVAVIGKDSLVSDNYYKDGMGINQTIEQDRLAVKLNIVPIVTIQGTTAIISIQSDKMPAQAFLTLKLVHPTVSEKDITIRLLPTETGFIGDLPSKVKGRRYLDLYGFDESWRIREEVYLPLNQHTLKSS
ncbi:MAG: hypothetical protein ACI9T7_001238 [Oleiphilaceae bacterium]|jgi:hypothetical protein